MNETIVFVDRIIKVYDELVEYRNMLEQKKDPRATFTYAYSIMTLTIAEKFEEAQFKNNEWVTSLTEAFANHYITALKAYDNDNTAPGGWQIAFDTICKSKSSVLEELVISMYVHIVQDLPLSLIKVGLEGQQGASGMSDYHKMNELLILSINGIHTCPK